MSDCLLVRGARQLLTLRGGSGPRRGCALRELGVIPDGAILIRDGVIESVGPSRRVENLTDARTAREIDATGRVVMPGFVDSHTHLVCGPARLLDYEMRLAGASYQQIAEAGGGIPMSVRAVRSTPGSRLLMQAQRTMKGLIRHGTTTVEVKSGYGLDESGEMKMLRVLAALRKGPLDVVPTYLGAHAVPLEYQANPDEYVHWMCSYLMPKIRRRNLTQFVDVYCEQGAFTPQQARTCLEVARGLGFSLKIHAAQFGPCECIRLAVEVEAVSVDHLDYADEDDIVLLAASPTIATLLPGAVAHLGLDHYPPARALIEAGAAAALATDYNPGTSPTYSMPMILSLACTEMRMTPAEAICAATINGAHALRCADRVGSIEAGKQADLIILDVPDYRELPYRFGVNQVYMTIKRGALLYQQAEVQWPEE